MNKEEETMSMTNEPLTFQKLVEATHDPADAMHLAADLFAMSTYRAMRALAIEAGRPAPAEPKTVSKYMRRFKSVMKAKLHAIAEAFDETEVQRLKKIGPSVSAQLDRNDTELLDQVLKLMCMDPALCVAWIREHLDEIEARFAS